MERRADRLDAGDALLRSLNQEHGGAVQSFARRLLGGDSHAAEDVLQETWVVVWHKREELVLDERSLRPWLFTVAKYLAFDLIRARRARPTEVPESDAVDSSLDELADSVVGKIRVLDALSELTPEHRAAIFEVYYRGNSYADAAVVLGIKPGTVKSRVHYALQALGKSLAESPDVDSEASA